MAKTKAEWEADAKELFRRFDKDKNGIWSKKELGLAMRKLGLTPSQAQIEETFVQLDKNKNGKIEYKEFLVFMEKEMAKRDSPEEQSKMMTEAFQMFDRDRNGFIDSKELKKAMKTLGEPLTNEQCEAMIKDADMDGDGKINYIEFVRKWTEVGESGP